MKIVRRALAFSMIIVSLWCLVTALIFGLQCRPLSVAWGVGEGSCLSTAFLGTTGLALSGMDVTISWLYAVCKTSFHDAYVLCTDYRTTTCSFCLCICYTEPSSA